jgi:hypothetical protein
MTDYRWRMSSELWESCKEDVRHRYLVENQTLADTLKALRSKGIPVTYVKPTKYRNNVMYADEMQAENAQVAN